MVEATVRELVATFDSRDDLERAIEGLGSAGFHRSRLSVLGSVEAVEEKLGHRLRRTTEVRDDPEVPRREPIDRAEVGDAVGVTASIPAYLAAVLAAGVTAASGGTLAGVAVAALAAGAGGGAVGAAVAKALGNRMSRDVAEKLQRGGLLLWVSVHDEAEERKATQVLRSCNAGSIEVHEIPASG